MKEIVVLVAGIFFAPVFSQAQPVVHYFTASHDTVEYGQRVLFEWHVAGADSLFFTGPEKVSGNLKLGERGSIELRAWRSYHYKMVMYYQGVAKKVTVSVFVQHDTPAPLNTPYSTQTVSGVCYPNPFTADISIVWTEEAFVAEVYNTQGQLVAKECSKKGTTNVPLNHVPAGNYFVRLSSQTKTKQMIVTKR